MFLHLCMPVSFQTQTSALWLAKQMRAAGHSVALLSGEMRVERRAAVLNRFRKGSKTRLLIIVNVSTRGIDVEQVSTRWLPQESLKTTEHSPPKPSLPKGCGVERKGGTLAFPPPFTSP